MKFALDTNTVVHFLRGRGRVGEALRRVAPFDVADAESAALVRAELEARGTPIGPYDTLIAGMALARGCVLVTHDTREFSRVVGLRIEDWFQGP